MIPSATSPLPRVAGVELEPWESKYLVDNLGPGQYLAETLDQAGDLNDPEILSIFIYSPITDTVLKKFPHLKFIATRSTGYDHVDLAACHQRGIVVSNVPVYGEQTVAEHALALLLALTRKIVPSVEQTRQGNFHLADLRGVDLAGKTAGVVGTGRIGQHFIRIVRGLGMTVLASDPRPDLKAAKELGFRYVELDRLLTESDVVSLHAPAVKETFHLLHKKRLMLMKPTAYLINTARGTLIDTLALLETLAAGRIAGVGLDVLEEECTIREERQLLSAIFNQQCDLKTMLADHMLLEHPKVIITPHNAFNSHEALERILATTVENIQAWATGQPINVAS